MTCEKCWSDSYSFDAGLDQRTRYYELLRERIGTPCSAKEQAGQFWDEETKSDKRRIGGNQ